MTMLQTLARRGHPGAVTVLDSFNADQAREQDGKWAPEGNGGGGTSEKKGWIAQKWAAAKATVAKFEEDRKQGKFEIGKGHEGKPGAIFVKGQRVKLRDSMLERLKAAGHQGAVAVLDAYNPDQLRDEKGMWTAGATPGGLGSTERADFHEAAAAKHRELASTSGNQKGHLKAAAAHSAAAAANRNAKPGLSYQAHLASTQASSLSAEAHKSGGEVSRDLRKTQVEMPAVKEAPVALMAPHSQLPVGNTKPKEPIHDLKQTQRLPAVQERSTGLNQAAAATAYQSREKREAELRAIRDNPNRTPAQAVKAGLGFVKRSEMTKESRRDAAAASAGRWASRASEVKAKGQTQEDRQRISANLRAKGDPTKAARFMQQSEQATALSKANALSALAAQHTARGDHAMAAKTYEEARAHYVRAGKDKVAAKMTWSKLEAEGKARKGGK